MTTYQKELLINFVKDLKHIAIRRQAYEAAAFSRDMEKTLSSPDFETSIENAEKYYELITKIYKEKYSFLSISDLESLGLKEQHDFLYGQIHRQEIRQRLILQILEDKDQQNNLDSEQ